MSINGLLYDHPEVRPAIEEACGLIDRWLDGLDPADQAVVQPACSGYERIALIEAIATALLARSGITDEDLDAFEEIYTEHCCDGVRDEVMFEQWDAERKAART